MKKKALLFYISRFSGHYHAAKAIEGALRDVGDIDVKLVNSLDFTNPILGKIVLKAYTEVVKKKPEIWGNMYDNPAVMAKTRAAREKLQKKGFAKINDLFEDFKPDIVYCTQAYPCGIVAGYKSQFKDTVPLVGVLTDRAPHSYWLFDEVDVYVVPSRETAKVFLEKGVPADKILEYGIPIDMKFSVKHDRSLLISQLGLDGDRKIILLMGGNQGLGAIEGVCRSIMKDKQHDYQVLVITGKNKKLYRNLHRMLSAEEEDRIKLFSYVENMDELMEISDVIVTKAGGMTTSEALAKNIPMIIVDPIPGQERMNADQLVRERAAVEVSDTNEVLEKIKELFDSGNLIDEMKNNAMRLAKPDSSSRIAGLAEKGIQCFT